MLKYRCLVLDHDDTVVRSTPDIHYPSFQKTLAALRPDVKMSLADFMAYCFDPGFNELCRSVLGFSEDEMAFQLATWRSFVDRQVPGLYAGIDEIIRRQKQFGGLVCVVSHSCSDTILRDYEARIGVLPDRIFGWELGEDQRKPSPYPLVEIMRGFGLAPGDLLMVDDLKPGFDMARSCGVDFAYAGWSSASPAIAAFMSEQSDFAFQTVEELGCFLFSK